MRIAVLDDEGAHSAAVEQVLIEAGHACAVYSTGKALVAALRRETYDLLILDWNLPGMSGLEVMQWIRQNLTPPPPMLLLTARTSEEDIVEGLNAGADDYVVKPVQKALLLARLNAVCRRAYPGEPGDRIETYCAYSFDIATESVQIGGGEPLRLTSKEFALALLLFRNSHRALSRAHLLETVWGHNPDLMTRTLDMHISRIRNKLNLRPQNGFRLGPVYSYGYRLEYLGGVGDGAQAAIEAKG